MDAVEANTLGLDWARVWGCTLAERDDLRIWLGLVTWGSGWGKGYLKMSCCMVLMCSGPAILFAVGPYVVTAQGGFSVSNGSRDVHISAGDRNSASWPGSSCFISLAL